MNFVLSKGWSKCSSWALQKTASTLLKVFCFTKVAQHFIVLMFLFLVLQKMTEWMNLQPWGKNVWGILQIGFVCVLGRQLLITQGQLSNLKVMCFDLFPVFYVFFQIIFCPMWSCMRNSSILKLLWMMCECSWI